MIETQTVMAGIVAWNPDARLPSLVSVLRAADVDVVVVDNGSTDGATQLASAEANGAFVVRLGRNLGIAAGLARLFEEAQRRDRTWVHTLDQDSVIDVGLVTALLGSSAWQEPDIAIVGPVVFDASSGQAQQGDPTRSHPYPVDAVITSGSLCRVAAIAAIGVRTDLFIDYVDWDLSFRLHSAGWRIAIEPTARLQHTIGQPSEHRLPLLGLRVRTSNHSADRQYYKFRNFLLLLRSGTTVRHRRWLARNGTGLALAPIKVALLEQDRRTKLKAIAAGVLDGLRGRGGARPSTRSLGAPRETTVRLSVCMATYNGSRFVAAQIRSILDELDVHDEIVVVDDASTDDTVRVLRGLDDPRIRIVESAVNAGHVRTFERALSLAQGRYLMLADQDDLWPAGRVEPMLAALQTSTFVVGNQSEATGDRLGPGMDDRPWRNVMGLGLGRRGYFGCAMGMRREFLDTALPFPAGVQAHDHWLAIAANLRGRAVHLAETVVTRTVHDSNLTPRNRRGWSKVIRTRVTMLRLVAVALMRRRASS